MYLPPQWDEDILGQPFIPRQNALPIPETSFDESPTNAFGINRKWLSHVLGALEVLCQPDAWEGTNEQVLDAIAAIEAYIEEMAT